MTTTTNVEQLKLNIMTQAQYDQITPSPTELYMITDASTGGTWGSITGTLSNQTDLQNALDGKVTTNTSITGATKCKITYDSKGLVTSGADLVASDIPDISATYQTVANLTTTINSSSTNTTYPSAKAVYDNTSQVVFVKWSNE